MTIFDSHTHIHFPDYDKDRDEVIKRAQAAGVKIITVGTDYQTSQEAVAIAEKYPDDIWATVGVHPAETQNPKLCPFGTSPEGGKTQNYNSKLKTLAKHPKVVAIGECGLDYYRNLGDQKSKISRGAGSRYAGKNQKLQKEVFLKQIRLAAELNKPLMIHCRPSRGTGDAYEDLITVIAAHRVAGEKQSLVIARNEVTKQSITTTTKRKIASASPRNDNDLIPRNDIIVHFFAGSLEIAKQLLELGCYFTFGGVITFSRDYDEVIKFIPLENILLETDAPYVAPVPYRGKRNEPAYVVEVAKKLAEIKGLSFEEVARQTTENVERVFGIKKLDSRFRGNDNRV